MPPRFWVFWVDTPESRRFSTNLWHYASQQNCNEKNWSLNPAVHSVVCEVLVLLLLCSFSLPVLFWNGFDSRGAPGERDACVIWRQSSDVCFWVMWGVDCHCFIEPASGCRSQYFIYANLPPGCEIRIVSCCKYVLSGREFRCLKTRMLLFLCVILATCEWRL